MLGISLNNSAPIYEQLTLKIEQLVLKGVLEPNEQLPSVRELATSLAINPNTVQKAYTYLEQIGVTYSVNGKGRFVTQNIDLLKKKKIEMLLDELNVILKKLKALDAEKNLIMQNLNALYEEGKK